MLADAVVACSADLALGRLAHLLSANPRLLVGPGTLRKQVLATLGSTHEHDFTHVVDLTWEPTGSLARCYPALDARLALTAIDDTSSLLTLSGRYRPPMGAFGAVADRAALHRVAESTARGVVRRLTALLADRAPTSEEDRHGRQDVDAAADR